MAFRDRRAGLFAEALELLRDADRMHRQFFEPAPAPMGGPCWEPPADIIEHEGTLVIRVVLPGVAPDTLSVTYDGVSLHVRAIRPLEVRAGDAIHRLEIPYGRFERRIELPPGRYEIEGRALVDGCLVLGLRRLV